MRSSHVADVLLKRLSDVASQRFWRELISSLRHRIAAYKCTNTMSVITVLSQFRNLAHSTLQTKVSLTLVTKRKVSTFTEVGIAVTIGLGDRLSSDCVVLGLSEHILKYL